MLPNHVAARRQAGGDKFFAHTSYLLTCTFFAHMRGTAGRTGLSLRTTSPPLVGFEAAIYWEFG